MRLLNFLQLAVGCGWGVTVAYTVAEVSSYLTRPDLQPLTLTVHVNTLDPKDKSLLFFGPYISGYDGPAIYDLKGLTWYLKELVWDGYLEAPPGLTHRAHNLHPMLYKGITTLAYSLVLDRPQTSVMVHHTFLNEHYDIVDALGTPDQIKHLDPHDFSVIDDGTKMLQLAYIAHPTDEHDPVQSKVEEGILEVLDISTGTIDFEWRSLDHVPRNHSCVGGSLVRYLVSRDFTPLVRFADEDFLHPTSHANSVDQDPHGNFILSSFHTCTIYSISPITGSVLWRLGGAFSDFTFLPYHNHGDKPVTLKHVHDVRSHPLSIALENPLISQSLKRRIKASPHTYLVLSLFDNAFGAAGPPTSSCSSALIILLDLNAMTAKILERYMHPRGEYNAMFGSVQLLSNGHRFVGWGSTRQVSEYDGQGKHIYHAELGDPAQLIGSLRVYKSAMWNGVPANRGPDV
ncbi:MAG: hypothetical protein Q9174_001405 [Haloplaca sp. 1 TL-2023]